MGQAFDRDGRELTSATGDTKREVLDKLMEAAPEAAEVRIRTIEPGDPVSAPTEPILQYFSFSHLPERLQAVSEPYYLLALRILMLPRNPERTVALRKLLEVKDAAVRAALTTP